MYNFFTFLHIFGFIVWLGLLIAMVIVLPMVKNQLDTEVGRNLVRKVIRSFNILMHLSAVVVLASGIFRVVERFSDMTKPFWLLYMEMGGGMIVLLGIVALTFLGRGVTKHLSPGNTIKDTSVVEKKLSTYITAAAFMMLLVLSVVVVVAFRF